MSVVDDDDVVAMVLAFGPREWHVMTPACTCFTGVYDAGPQRTAATYHVPTGRLARTDGIELNKGEVCGNCQRALKARIRDDREREQFQQRRRTNCWK